MTPKDCFGVAVRIVGLVVILLGIREFCSFAVIVTGPRVAPYSPPPVYLSLTVVYLVVGIYLVHGAPPLINWCYPNTELIEPDDPDGL